MIAHSSRGNTKLLSCLEENTTEVYGGAPVSFERSDYNELGKIAQRKNVPTSRVIRDAVSSYPSTRTPLFQFPNNKESGS